MAAAETARLIASLELKDKGFSTGLKSAERTLSGFDKATARTQRSLSKTGQNIQRGVLIGGAAIAAGAFAVVNAASDYEQAFAGVRKTVDATEPELQKLSDAFREMSKTIPITASELAALGEAGGALGIDPKNLQEFVRVTALLGETTNLTADEAATSLGTLGNVLGLTGDQFSKFGSALVALGNAGASTEADIVSITERFGAAGHLVGLTTEQILAFSSAAASLGIEAEAGGTALQNFVIGTAKAVSEGGKDLGVFAKTAGTSAKAFKQAFETDAGGALEDFLAGLGKLSQGEQIQVLDSLGFSGARLTQTLLGLANNTALVTSQMGVANDAYAANTALTKEAEQRNKTFASQLQITKNVINDIAITIGTKLLPKLVPLLQKFNDFIKTRQGDIEKFGDTLAEGFTKFADELQRVDWTPFIDGLKLAAQITKTAIDLFRSLPKEVQALAITGLAVNKLTGGLVTSVAKDVAGIAIDFFKGRGSTPANPLFVADVTGGKGAPITPTGVAGGVGGLVTSLGAGSLAVGAAAVAAALAAGAGLGIIMDAANRELQKTNVQGTIANPFDPTSWIGNIQTGFEVLGKAIDGSATKIVASTVNEAGDTRSELAGIRASGDAQKAKQGDIAARIGNLDGTLRPLGKLGAKLDTLHQDFLAQKGVLEKSTDPAAIAKAAAALAADIVAGVGSTQKTGDVLGSLKTQRAAAASSGNTTLVKALDAAIAKITPKFENRKFVDDQLRILKDIESDGTITADELKTLSKVQKDLKAHGDTHAAGIVKSAVENNAAKQKAATDAVKGVVRQSGSETRSALQRVEAAASAAAGAARGTTEAVKDKDLSFTANLTTNITIPVSLYSISKAQKLKSRLTGRIGGFN